MAGVEGRSGPPGNQNHTQSGVYGLIRARKRGKLDGRTALSKAFAEAKQEYVAALGGADVSPQELALVTDTVWMDFYVAAIDSYVASLKHLVRKGRAHPLLDVRVRLAAHRRENLRALGLKRRPKPTQSLAEMLRERAGQNGSDGERGGSKSEVSTPEPGEEARGVEIVAQRGNGGTESRSD